MRKPRSWLTLGGCFLVQFVVFFCVFFCCLFVLAPRTVFYGFLCDFELIFDSISWVFCSKVEVVFFATLLSKTMIFKVPGLLFFSVFFQSFPHSIPDLIFLVFLLILGSPRLPFWSFWAWFFDIKKKSWKRVCDCLRPTRREGGGPFKEDNRFLQKQLFNISSLQRCLKARWRILVFRYQNSFFFDFQAPRLGSPCWGAQMVPNFARC